MNIKTKSVEAITQQLLLPLFNEVNFVEEPILFFGYKKNEIGNLSEPKLIYLDEEHVQWVVTMDEVIIDKSIEIPTRVQKVATPILKKEIGSDKKVG